MNINSIVNLRIILQRQKDETRSCPGTGMHMTPGITSVSYTHLDVYKRQLRMLLQ